MKQNPTKTCRKKKYPSEEQKIMVHVLTNLINQKGKWGNLLTELFHENSKNPIFLYY